MASAAEYDRDWTGNWEAIYDVGPMVRTRMRLMQRWLKQQCTVENNAVVLDAGCGDGQILRAIADTFPATRRFGVEWSREAAERAVQRAVACSILTGDLQEPATVDRVLTVLPHRADLIICSEVLEHIPDDARALAALRRVISDTGSLFVTVPAWPEYWTNTHDTALGHLRRYTPETLHAVLEQTGWRVRWQRVWGWPVSYTYLRGVARLTPAQLSQGTKRAGAAARLASQALRVLFRIDDAYFGRRGHLLAVVADPVAAGS